MTEVTKVTNLRRLRSYEVTKLRSYEVTKVTKLRYEVYVTKVTELRYEVTKLRRLRSYEGST